MRTILTALCIIAAAAAHGDTKITLLADVTADRAEVVIGPQSNRLDEAHAHTTRKDNPHGVTAAQIGALTNEQDVAALRTYHYGSPDIVESPEEWFTIDIYGSVAIADATKVTDWDIVVPWEIGGNTVLGIGAGAFLTMPDYISMPVTSIYMPRGVNKIENMAFYGAYLLTNLVFAGTPPLMVNGSFSGVAAGLVATVQDPQATGWGSTLSDGGISIPVVRPNLYADNLYQGGERAATENYVDNSILNMSAPMLIIDGVTYRQYWDTNLLTTAWEPVQ